MDEEQVHKLVRIMTHCTMTVHEYRDFFNGKTFNEVGDWMREQLGDCGFPCEAVGMSHVRLDQSLFVR